MGKDDFSKDALQYILIISIAAIVFIAAGLYGLQKHSLCTERMEVKVCDTEMSEYSERRWTGKAYIHKSGWKQISLYTFDVGDSVYTVELEGKFPTEEYSLPDAITVVYDPDNPTNHYVDTDLIDANVRRYVSSTVRRGVYSLVNGVVTEKGGECVD